MANQQSQSGSSGGGTGGTTGSGGGRDFPLRYDRQSKQITIPAINESRSFSIDQFFEAVQRSGIDEKDVTRWYEQNRGGTGSSDQNRSHNR